MSPIDWNQSFSVGHAEVDRQHREFLNIINDVESNFSKPPQHYDCSTRLNILEKLLRFTAKHFELEQKLMQEFALPVDFCCNHWRSHKSFDAKLYTLYRQLLAKEWVLDSCILTAIRDKFFNHILKEDKILFQALFSGVTPHVYQEHIYLQTPCISQISRLEDIVYPISEFRQHGRVGFSLRKKRYSTAVPANSRPVGF